MVGDRGNDAMCENNMINKNQGNDVTSENEIIKAMMFDDYIDNENKNVGKSVGEQENPTARVKKLNLQCQNKRSVPKRMRTLTISI